MYDKAGHKWVHYFQRAPLQKLMCRYFVFKRAPNSNYNLKVIFFQKGPQQPLKCVSILLLNFIDMAPSRNWNV